MAVETRQIGLTSSMNAPMCRLVTRGMNYEQVRVVTHMNAEQYNPQGNMNAETFYVVNPEDVPSEFRLYIH
jgi:hypothetical protein